MKIRAKNRSVASKFQLLAIRSVQKLAGLLPRATGIALATWDEAVVREPKDSERCVEIPWVASGIARSLGLWLDIGYAHAEPRYWESIPMRTLRFGFGLDIAQPKFEQHPLQIEVTSDLIKEDLQLLPQFSLITCISTLEHIGCDNQIYHAQAGREEEPFKIQKEVLTKLLFKLAPRGYLMLSLPFGKFQDHGGFLQYDADLIDSLKAAALRTGKTIVSEKYYKLAPEGWVQCPREEMKDVAYRFEEYRAAGVVLLELT